MMIKLLKLGGRVIRVRKGVSLLSFGWLVYWRKGVRLLSFGWLVLGVRKRVKLLSLGMVGLLGKELNY